MVIIWPKSTMFHGSGAFAGVEYFCASFMYSIMPGSVVSPYSELAMRYVHLGKSPPRPAATWPVRHSGGETTFLESVMPCWMSALAMFTQGITDSKKVVSPPLCLNGQVAAGLGGDFPKWTYLIASSLYGDTTDPGMIEYMK